MYKAGKFDHGSSLHNRPSLSMSVKPFSSSSYVHFILSATKPVLLRMSFLRPSSLYQLLFTYPSLRWMPCQSWSFLRWPGLDGFFRLLVIALLWSTFSQLGFIQSSSMFPTLHVGDRILIEKASYYIRRPTIGDIITFRAPPRLLDMRPGFGNQDILIKRIVARAGDCIEVLGGLVYLNGIAQKEDFIAEKPAYTLRLTHVPKGHVFVLGDHRNNSFDSHDWGPLPVKDIVGRYVMCCYRPSNRSSN